MGVNAQTSVPTFTAGEVLTAANMNISASTGVPVFATTTTRDAAFGGTGEKTLAEGQYCYIEANNETQFYNGTAWETVLLPWTAYTPTWTNLTVGNATQSWSYQVVNQIVTVSGRLTLGTTSAVTGVPKMTLPVNRNSVAITLIGFGTLGDAGATTFMAYPISTELDSVFYFAVGTGGAYASEASTSATVPFIWGNTDFIAATLTYQKA